MNTTDRMYMLVLFIIVMLLIVSGCQPNEVKDNKGEEYNTIKSVELDRETQNLLGAVGVEKYFIFNFKIPEAEERRADVWVDYYENGEYISKIAGGGFSFGDDEAGNSGRLIMSINDLPNDIGQREFVVSLMDDKGFSSGSIAVPKREGDIYSKWDTIDEAKLSLNETINLAIMIEDQEGLKMDIDPEAFNNDHEAMDRVLKNDYVYILRCIFE